MNGHNFGAIRAITATLLLTLTCACSAVEAQTLTTLYSFAGTPDGSGPGQANLLDVNGTLYGTTVGGGAFGFGTVFELDSAGKETLLYSFTGGADGAYPISGLVRDTKGNYYGTTEEGGNLACSYFGINGGCGTVFKLESNGSLKVLHTFSGGVDGAGPQGLLLDKTGNLYGITFLGGDLNCFTGDGCGVIFKMDLNGNETVLYSFMGGTDGWFPNGFLSMDRVGNIYGVTINGGNLADCSGSGCGVVFKLSPSEKYTVLYTFTGGADGAFPNGALLTDDKGNLYGTAGWGGDLSCTDPQSTAGCGVVFKIGPTGKETVLHSFKGPDGALPIYGLFADAKGNGYSTTTWGGTSGLGTVFEITSKGVENVLHNFSGQSDGSLPGSGFIKDSSGNLYSNTSSGGDLSCGGGAGCGTVFKIAP